MTISKEATKPDMLRLAVAAVLEADKEFRANMPPEWEGDPLSDEIDGLRRVYSALISSPGKDGGQEVEAVAWRRERDGWLNEQGRGVPLYTRPPHQITVDAELVERVARAIWNVRREEEDRCDMDLEDMGKDHSVWAEARAVLDSLSTPQPASTALVERLVERLVAGAWPIDTDDQVEALARECDWDNRKYMTPKDYAIWCERMRKFARLAVPSQASDWAIEHIDRLTKALEPFSTLQIPKKAQYNAGAYSIRHSDIEAARAALSSTKSREGER